MHVLFSSCVKQISWFSIIVHLTDFIKYINVQIVPLVKQTYLHLKFVVFRFTPLNRHRRHDCTASTAARR
jgi:hypothetical protein